MVREECTGLARAAGEVDSEKRMNTISKRAKEREVNRKMTNAIKGYCQGLDRIEVPIFEWYYSDRTKEIYRYVQGVFKAYAAHTPQAALRATNPTRFYLHHHLKVIPDDAVRIDIRMDADYIHITHKYSAQNIWRDITNPSEIEHIILERNKRHLQQASIEEGQVHDPIMQAIIGKAIANRAKAQSYKNAITANNRRGKSKRSPETKPDCITKEGTIYRASEPCESPMWRWGAAVHLDRISIVRSPCGSPPPPHLGRASPPNIGERAAST